MWWGDRGLSKAWAGEGAEPDFLNMDEMWRAWETQTNKTVKHTRQTHRPLTWDTQISEVYAPPSKL